MALATRELELVIIARDHASAVLARVGGAMALLGAGAARVGMEGVGFFADATMEAIDFRKAVAVAFTQVEIAGATFDDVLNLIRESARKTSVPIDELTESAYDIFSTLTLDNMDQARELLDSFAQSAVAGDAPIRDIGRATIAWMNALDMAPTVENATRILDNQFELVRKGAGTYTEFASVMGKAIPPFVAAGQEVEMLSGALAFLTRNGLSAAEASTSASRAVELLYSAKAIGGLNDIGIAVEDINGQFRPMDELLSDVVEHFSDLSDAEKKLEFKEIFGQGRIQARRFFDLILAEGNFEEFLFLLDEVETSSGEVAKAFDIMAAEPAVQLDHLKNRFEILRQEIGDYFIPLLTGKLIPLMDRILDAWEELDEIQKNNLVKWAAFSTLFVTIGGGISAVVGSLLLLVGLFKAFAGSMGLAIILAGGTAAIISAIAAAIALAVLDWDKFVEIFGPWWTKILDKMQPVADWIKTNWPEAWAIAEDAYQTALSWFENEWPGIWESFQSSIQGWLETEWPVIWENAQSALITFAEYVATMWEEDIREPITSFISWIQERWALIWEDIKAIFNDEFLAEWKPLWEEVVQAVEDNFPLVVELLLSVGSLIIAVIGTIVKVVLFIWDNFGHLFVEGMRIILQLISGMLETALLYATGTMDVIIGILTLDWDRAAKGFSSIAEANTTAAATAFNTVKDTIVWSVDIMDTVLGDAEADFESFNHDVSASLGDLADDAEYYSGRVWRAMNDMSPYTPHSPPLVAQFQTGFDEMSSTVHKELMYIQRQAERMAPRIQSALSNTVNNPELAMAGAGASMIRPSLIPQQASSTGVGQNIEKQINIDKLESKADPIEIAEEIAWKAMNS